MRLLPLLRVGCANVPRGADVEVKYWLVATLTPHIQTGIAAIGQPAPGVRYR